MILNICPNPSIDTYAWLDEIKPGQANRISRMQAYPGGKGTHVALALGELGMQVALFGLWAGKSGAWIREECRKRGVKTLGPELSEGTNRTCFTFRSENPAFDNTELLEPGPQFEEKVFSEYWPQLADQWNQIEWVCASGSWPAGAPGDAYFQLAEKMKSLGKKLILDASGLQLVNALKSSFFGLHLNESEARSLAPDGRIESLIRRLEGRVSLIALTKGKKGLWLYYQNERIHARLDVDNIYSTVGSGDCLTAGLVYALSHGYTPEETARLAVACGGANCMNPDLGMIRDEDVRDLFNKVQIKSLIHV